MKEFEDDLKAELSAAYPNYMTVLKTAKEDLLRKDCSIVITGNNLSFFFQKYYKWQEFCTFTKLIGVSR